MKKVKPKRVLMLSLSTYRAYASTYADEIPIEMPSGTLIKYISDTEYEVISDDSLKKSLEYNEDDYNEVISPHVNLESDEMVIETYPKPCRNMFVQYGSDGQVNQIYTTKDIQVESQIRIIKQSQTRGVDDPSYKLIAQWGGYPNYLYKGVRNYDYLYYGRGRATVYNDKIGQRDHILVKGDITTSLRYDDCAYDTSVRVSMPNSNNVIKAVYMKKRDAGGMPNAIVDIWKTGVEYWGYKYSDTWSKGNATINHN